MPAPRKVSGADPTRSPFSAAVSISRFPFSVSTPSGFFAVDVFARFQDLQTDFDVRTRDGEVHDEFYLWICEQLIDGACVGVVFFGLCLCGFHAEVSTGFDF